jgi:hypothetical protein
VANVEYDSMKQLFMLLKVKKTHLSIVKHKWFGNCKGHASMHHVVPFKIKSIIAKVNFFVKNANKVTIIDNQQCINVHIYVMKIWKHIPILLILEKVEVGAISNNIIIVILEAMANYRGLPMMT